MLRARATACVKHIALFYDMVLCINKVSMRATRVYRFFWGLQKSVSTVDMGLFSPVSLQCPTPTYLCRNIPAVPVPNPKVSWNPGNARPLQCPTQICPCCEVALYPGSAQPQRILAVPNPKVSLQRPNPKYQPASPLNSKP